MTSLHQMGRLAAGMLLVLAVTPLSVAAPKHGTTDYQFFDSAESAASVGWVGSNNDPIAGTGGAGGHIRFYNTNSTLGNPAGEAGGNLSRTDGVPAYYADTTIGGPTNVALDVGDRMFASGELFIDRGPAGPTVTPNGDTQFIVGYFDRTLPNNQVAGGDFYVGFRLDSGNNFRANVFGGDYGGYDGTGGNAGQPIQATINDGVYTWTMDYVPGGFTVTAGQFQYGEITVTLTPVAGGANGPFTLRNALNPAQNRLARQLNTFGLLAYNGDDSNSTLTNTYFVDNLAYFVVPEPATGVVAAAALAVSLTLRRRRSR